MTDSIHPCAITDPFDQINLSIVALHLAFPHPKSGLGHHPRVHFDQLDESYPMVIAILQIPEATENGPT